MKNKFIFLALISTFVLSSCNSSDKSDEFTVISTSSTSATTESDYVEPVINTTLEANKGNDLIEVREELFVTQCMNIYNNSKEYEGKTITIEGMYDEYTDSETGETYSYVYRNSPGCCGNDGAAGFEFAYDGEKPNLNDWIKVTGEIEVVEFDSGFKTILLDASDLEVLDERGKEFVMF